MTTLPNVLQKVTARVFVSSTLKGGNPVTVFLSQQHLAPSLQRQLAQTCEWESVVVHDSIRPRLQFYMPSGGEVSFCAHAAIGASHTLFQNDNNRSNELVFDTTNNQQPQTAIARGTNEVGLRMTSVFQQDAIEDMDTLQKLWKQIQVPQDHVLASTMDRPSFVNASIARPKTLVHMSSVTALRGAQAPTDPDAFRKACDDIDSTGLYLYTVLSTSSTSEIQLECRQFPRVSGYPEDPATGIAAGALAVSLHKATPTTNPPHYTIHQGTAMGRPSIIQIENVELHDNDYDLVSFECWGKVQVDSNQTIRRKK